MPEDSVDKMVKQVRCGVAPEKVVNAESKREEPPYDAIPVIKCSNCRFTAFVYEGSACPTCGAIVSRLSVPLGPGYQSDYLEGMVKRVIPRLGGTPDRREGLFKLGWLRPDEKFIFEQEVPDPGLELNIEYLVIPAKHGFLSFRPTLEKTPFTISLEHALFFIVKVLSPVSDPPDHRFYKGDSAKSRRSGRCGIVLGMSGEGYTLKDCKTDEIYSEVGVNLYLVNKKRTTESYIEILESKIVVKVGGHERVHGRLVDALRDLRGVGQTQFFRYSKMLADSGKRLNDDDLIGWLIKVDPRIWAQEGILRKQGVLRGSDTVADVLNRYEDRWKKTR